MSGDDKNMDEILGDIRTLSRGGTPGERHVSEVPIIGRKVWILVLPAMAISYLLFGLLSRWSGLPNAMLGDFAMLMSLAMIPDFLAGSRPTSCRHWVALGGTALCAAVVSVVTAVGMSWLIVRVMPEYSEGIPVAFGLFFVCFAAVLLILWFAHRLTRANNLIFPRDEEESEG